MNIDAVSSQLGKRGQSNATPDAPPARTSHASGSGSALKNLAGGLPAGLAGGAAAGSIMALLMGSKKARKKTKKVAGTAATMGGAALLGGLAYRAYQNWQSGQYGNASSNEPHVPPTSEGDFTAAATGDAVPGFEWTLVKAMVAAAKVDGHLDSEEQQRIHGAVQEMNLPAEARGQLFDLLAQDISIDALVSGVQSVEQKTELYLASRLAVDPDHPAEQEHLRHLAQRLELPAELIAHLDAQAARMD